MGPVIRRTPSRSEISAPVMAMILPSLLSTASTASGGTCSTVASSPDFSALSAGPSDACHGIWAATTCVGWSSSSTCPRAAQKSPSPSSSPAPWVASTSALSASGDKRDCLFESPGSAPCALRLRSVSTSCPSWSLCSRLSFSSFLFLSFLSLFLSLSLSLSPRGLLPPLGLLLPVSFLGFAFFSGASSPPPRLTRQARGE
mmetsp:Transcript_70668/g.185253  ORF Transcript_70668/g.185253 Transcript_70668/m.185253 type:complete len:201 (+) Transcript_70668:1703-2305(+)